MHHFFKPIVTLLPQTCVPKYKLHKAVCLWLPVKLLNVYYKLLQIYISKVMYVWDNKSLKPSSLQNQVMVALYGNATMIILFKLLLRNKIILPLIPITSFDNKKLIIIYENCIQSYIVDADLFKSILAKKLSCKRNNSLYLNWTIFKNPLLGNC